MVAEQIVFVVERLVLVGSTVVVGVAAAGVVAAAAAAIVVVAPEALDYLQQPHLMELDAMM